MRVAVRLVGYDAPERRGRCGTEREAAAAAKAALEELLSAGANVRLAGLRKGKYAGRVIARIVTTDGRDAGNALLAQSHGRRYDGRRESWCG